MAEIMEEEAAEAERRLEQEEWRRLHGHGQQAWTTWTSTREGRGEGVKRARVHIRIQGEHGRGVREENYEVPVGDGEHLAYEVRVQPKREAPVGVYVDEAMQDPTARASSSNAAEEEQEDERESRGYVDPVEFSETSVGQMYYREWKAGRVGPRAIDLRFGFGVLGRFASMREDEREVQEREEGETRAIAALADTQLEENEMLEEAEGSADPHCAEGQGQGLLLGGARDDSAGLVEGHAVMMAGGDADAGADSAQGHQLREGEGAATGGRMFTLRPAPPDTVQLDDTQSTAEAGLESACASGEDVDPYYVPEAWRPVLEAWSRDESIGVGTGTGTEAALGSSASAEARDCRPGNDTAHAAVAAAETDDGDGAAAEVSTKRGSSNPANAHNAVQTTLEAWLK